MLFFFFFETTEKTERQLLALTVGTLTQKIAGYFQA
jgi:hypothetical protein